ncbi:MAG: hypothetical protein ACODAE_01505 [Gemmatimonadota bacterium]
MESMKSYGSARSRTPLTTVRCSVAILLTATSAATFPSACAPADGAPRLTNAAPSSAALVDVVLDALEAGDRDRLWRLLVTAEEHRTLLWPELPESRHMPFEFARSLNEANSRKALARALDDFGGRRFEFVSLEFARPAEVYETFTLHRGARLRVRRSSDGRIGELPILDAILERGGRWKPMNYAD